MGETLNESAQVRHHRVDSYKIHSMMEHLKIFKRDHDCFELPSVLYNTDYG